ncbi:adenylate kinase [candidate division TA06 bacterium DG_26]|uniref:Adenylate kinase n=1 Tax=candidate division TA06 bacterium DG_26 TaxID=1703771 RepID=A0A0S7WER6_UNCT6|nr:MAG: adenylate kinase [candidate division TA06 bacterium DG_26]
MRISFLGPPGSGKGTQAERLSKEFGIPHIATGDILRDTIRKDTSLGKKVKAYLGMGRLVPDDIITELILEKIDKAEDFLIDGFPRTLAQAERLEKTAPIGILLFFQVSEATIVSRLAQRRICPSCGRVYNLTSDPPIIAGVCDRCGRSLIVREDDRETTVKRRLEVYRGETLPLIEYYERKGTLRYLDAEGDPDTVYEKIKRIVCGDDNSEV